MAEYERSGVDILEDFLRSKSRIYDDFMVLKQKGWKNPQGDKHFAKQRQRADSATNTKHQWIFFNMMKEIGDEMQAATGALRLPATAPQVLDLCMAPGGYTSAALKYNPTAQVYSITLPASLGGHNILVKHGNKDPRITVEFFDLTMLAADFGQFEIPADHPDAQNLVRKCISLDRKFDLVFCDGQVLRTHPRAPYRERIEASRLTLSELIFALQKIRDYGTLIILLHKVDDWEPARLLFQFSKFSRVTLFKPQRKHATRSSFYLIAQEVQVNHPEALAAVAEWRAAWHDATFTDVTRQHIHLETVDKFIAEFGDSLVRLGEPIWDIQKLALEKAPFIRGQEVSGQE